MEVNEPTDKHILAEVDVLRVITNALHDKDRVLLKLLAERLPDHSEAVRKLRKALDDVRLLTKGTSATFALKIVEAALEETKEFA